MAINNEDCFPLVAWLCYAIHDLQRQYIHFFNNYILNIIDYVLCFTTTHFLYDQVISTQRLLLSLLLHIYIYKFKITCYILIIIIIEIMGIFKCYFSGEHTALSLKKQQRCEHKIRKNQQTKSTVHGAIQHMK